MFLKVFNVTFREVAFFNSHEQIVSLTSGFYKVFYIKYFSVFPIELPNQTTKSQYLSKSVEPSIWDQERNYPTKSRT